MTHSHFLRIKKLTEKAIILVAARHNHREILAEFGAAKDGHIDPGRSILNQVLRGPKTAVEVAELSQSLLNNAGVKKLRKDAVRGLEIVFSLSPTTTINHIDYFTDALAWADAYFNAPIISAVVHMDEVAPHCHVIVLPLVAGRMVGSDLMGSRAKLQAMHADFHTQVGQSYGLQQSSQKRLSVSVRREAARFALNAIKAKSELLNQSSVAQSLVDAITANPEPLMVALNLDMPKSRAKEKSFVEIMTTPTKAANPKRFLSLNPIGFAPVRQHEKHQTLSCVGFDNSAISISPAVERQTDNADDEYIRTSDNEIAACYWDGERGEFIKLPIKTSSKHQIDEAVRMALRRHANH